MSERQEHSDHKRRKNAHVFWPLLHPHLDPAASVTSAFVPRRIAAWCVSLLTLGGFAATHPDSGTAAVGTHFEAVRGQAVAFEANAPPDTAAVRFFFNGEAQEDSTFPFAVKYDTDKLDPGQYKWSTYAVAGGGRIGSVGPQGSVTIFPVPKVPNFKASVLVVAGAPRVVGFVVSNVMADQTVRAWRYRGLKHVTPLHLQLRHIDGNTRVFHLRSALTTLKSGLVKLEVAPRQLSLQHGVEVRGRMTSMSILTNLLTGNVRVHQRHHKDCTTSKDRRPDLFRLPVSTSPCAIERSEPAVHVPIEFQATVPAISFRAKNRERHTTIPRARVDALVLSGRSRLWGLRISRLVPGARVRAWSQGFGRPHGPYPVELRRAGGTTTKRTYRIPGGKSWNPAGTPEIVLSIAPPAGAEVDGVPVLGRLYFGLLRQDRNGDTVLREQRGNFCTARLARGNRLPVAVNCITGKRF
jgi:hypothetical protein